MSNLGINNTNLYISVKQAIQNYGVSNEDVKKINTDGDDKITYKELQAYGVDKNKQLTNYFTTQIGAAAKTAKVNASNPFDNNSLKNSFTGNFNRGELSPRVDSDLGYSPVGNVLPRLYA